MLGWLNIQVEWLKSFISHGALPGQAQKGKTQSVAVFVVMWTFAFTYIRVSLATQTFVDIPMNWALMIAFVIGAKIYDSTQAAKNTPKE